MMLTSGGRARQRIGPEVVEALEVVPQRVREVLVEGHDPGVIGAGHHPAPALLEQADADLATELVVDVAADTEREVDLLRLEPGDLLAKQLERRVVVGARHPEQFLVALVAAEDRVRQVEEDDRRLGEVGEALVLEPAAGHQVAGDRGIDDLVGVDGAVRRDVVDDRLVGDRLVADARPAVPRRALPEALGRGVGVDLRRLEPVLGRRPRRGRARRSASRPAMSERLNASVFGHSAFDPKPSASRWYGVSRSDEPSPEKTVRIVTVWPSSRRLAMRPPHESATSSGCGATKTWVMAGRVYRAARPAGRRALDLTRTRPGR